MKQYNKLYHLLYRVRNSLFFRILCVSYAILLLFTHKDNFFSGWIYLIFFILYISGYIYLAYYTKSVKANSIRLLWDYFFIIVISYGKNVTEISTAIFTLLPVYNAINFTGNKRSPLLLISCAMLSYIFLYYAYYHNIPIAWGFLGLFCIDYYSSVRWKTELVSDNLMDIIDDFYSNAQKPHSIYEKAIEQINIMLKKHKKSILEIFCFVLNDDKFNIVNSSKQVISYHVEMNSKTINLLRIKGYVNNISFQYDNMSSKYNYGVYIKSVSNTGIKEYLFIVVLSKGLDIYDEFSGIKVLLQTFFTRIAKLLHNESKLAEMKRASMREIRNRSRFVEQSVNTMHFIRNRLSPYLNLLQLIEEKRKADLETKQVIDQMIIKQYKTAKHELEQVVLQANFLLERENNPFSFQDLSTYSVMKIVTKIRNVWKEYFKEEDLDVQKLDIEECNRLCINTNMNGLDLLFSDWISNMSKHKNKYASCSLYIEQNHFVIEFNNDYLCQERDLVALINDLNLDDRKQITRRTTHGIYFIKQVIDELQIAHAALKKSVNEISVLTLTFKFQFVDHE